MPRRKAFEHGIVADVPAGAGACPDNALPDADFETFVCHGVRTNVARFLQRLEGRHDPDGKLPIPASGMATPQSCGVLLEYSGAGLQFLATRPLAAPENVDDLPETCVTMLGGPKGISTGIIDAI